MNTQQVRRRAGAIEESKGMDRIEPKGGKIERIIERIRPGRSRWADDERKATHKDKAENIRGKRSACGEHKLEGKLVSWRGNKDRGIIPYVLFALARGPPKGLQRIKH